MFNIDPVILAFLKDPDFLNIFYPVKAIVCLALLYITISHLRDMLKHHYKVVELSSHAKVTRFDTPILHIGFILYIGYILITTLIAWAKFSQIA